MTKLQHWITIEMQPDKPYLIKGDVVCDRMREHFEILILDGKSLRGVI